MQRLHGPPDLLVRHGRRPAPVPEQVVGYGPDVCTPIHYLSLDLAREAEAIVVADVTGIECRWLERMIWTDTRLSVRE